MDIAPDEAFVRACSRAATGVSIVTTHHAQSFGQTVSAVTRVSDEPAVLSVCINRRSPMNAALQERNALNVSMLARDQRPVADSFAGRAGPDRDRFTFLQEEWTAGENGIALLRGAVAQFECEISAATEVGSHWLYLAEVRSACFSDEEPLLYLRGAYRELSPTHPAKGTNR